MAELHGSRSVFGQNILHLSVSTRLKSTICFGAFRALPDYSLPTSVRQRQQTSAKKGSQMTPRFRIGQVLFNRSTNEEGRVRRVYESDGSPKYEVVLPGPPEYDNLPNRSNWNEGFLEVAQDQIPVENHLCQK